MSSFRLKKNKKLKDKIIDKMCESTLLYVLRKYKKLTFSRNYYSLRHSVGNEEQKEYWFQFLDDLRSFDGGVIIEILLENNLIKSPICDVEEYEAAESEEHFWTYHQQR